MTTLADLNGTEKPTLESLNLGTESTPPVISKASNVNLASQAALLNGDAEQVVPVYRAVSAEQDVNNKSKTADGIFDGLRHRPRLLMLMS